MTALLGGVPVATAPPLICRQEGVTLAPGQTLVLADLAGAGTIRQVFIAIGSGGGKAAYDSVLAVTTDGRKPEDWRADLGTLFTTHFGQQLNAQWSCDHAHAEVNRGGGGAAGYMLTLPQPFRDGARVVLWNPTNDPATVWTQVVYDRADPAPVRLRGTSATWTDRVTIPDTSAKVLAAPAGDGWLAWLSLVGMGRSGDGDAALGWLERNLRCTDGSGELAFETTGLEDTFGASFYYQGRQGWGTPWSMVGAVDTSRRVAAQAVDLLRLYGGIRYRGGLTATLMPQPHAPAHLMSWVALFYEQLEPMPA